MKQETKEKISVLVGIAYFGIYAVEMVRQYKIHRTYKRKWRDRSLFKKIIPNRPELEIPASIRKLLRLGDVKIDLSNEYDWLKMPAGVSQSLTMGYVKLEDSQNPKHTIYSDGNVAHKGMLPFYLGRTLCHELNHVRQFRSGVMLNGDLVGSAEEVFAKPYADRPIEIESRMIERKAIFKIITDKKFRDDMKILENNYEECYKRMK